MAERSGGDAPPPCVLCGVPLPAPGAKFCHNCGAPQYQMRSCIACGAPIFVGRQHCAYCRTDQNNPLLCINPRCQRPVIPTIMRCLICSTPRVQETTYFPQIPLSQGDPSRVRGPFGEGNPPFSGIHTQGYSAMRPPTASMPYAPESQAESLPRESHIYSQSPTQFPPGAAIKQQPGPLTQQHSQVPIYQHPKAYMQNEPGTTTQQQPEAPIQQQPEDPIQQQPEASIQQQPVVPIQQQHGAPIHKQLGAPTQDLPMVPIHPQDGALTYPQSGPSSHPQCSPSTPVEHRPPTSSPREPPNLSLLMSGSYPLPVPTVSLEHGPPTHGSWPGPPAYSQDGTLVHSQYGPLVSTHPIPSSHLQLGHVLPPGHPGSAIHAQATAFPNQSQPLPPHSLVGPLTSQQPLAHAVLQHEVPAQPQPIPAPHKVSGHHSHSQPEQSYGLEPQKDQGIPESKQPAGENESTSNLEQSLDSVQASGAPENDDRVNKTSHEACVVQVTASAPSSDEPLVETFTPTFAKPEMTSLSMKPLHTTHVTGVSAQYATPDSSQLGKDGNLPVGAEVESDTGHGSKSETAHNPLLVMTKDHVNKHKKKRRVQPGPSDSGSGNQPLPKKIAIHIDDNCGKELRHENQTQLLDEGEPRQQQGQQRQQDFMEDKGKLQRTEQEGSTKDVKTQITTQASNQNEEENREVFITPPSGSPRNSSPESDDVIVPVKDVNQNKSTSASSFPEEMESRSSSDQNQDNEGKDSGLKEDSSNAATFSDPLSPKLNSTVASGASASATDSGSCNIVKEQEISALSQTKVGTTQENQTHKPTSHPSRATYSKEESGGKSDLKRPNTAGQNSQEQENVNSSYALVAGKNPSPSSSKAKEPSTKTQPQRAVPKVGGDVPQGLKSSDEHSMTVIFRAIVPLDIWEWDDSSSMYIRFGNKKFGNWDFDAGPGRRIRDAGNSLHIFVFKLKMNTTFLKGTFVPYKYVIFSNRLAEQNDPHEFLYEVPYAHSSEVFNRCLRVPDDKCCPKGKFFQHDTIVYPRSKASPSLFSRALSYVSRSKPSEKEHPQFTVPHSSLLLETSLRIHLQPSKDTLLQGDFGEKYDISGVANHLIDLYNLFMSRIVTNKDNRRVVPWKDDSVSKGMRDWLTATSSELFQSDSLQPEKKLCSAMTILCCFHLLRNQLYCYEAVQLNLLRMSALSPSGEKDFQYLLSVMHRVNSRELVVESLTHLFISVVKRGKDDHTIHLLRALPLIHFLRNDLLPNSSVPLSWKSETWDDPHLDFERVHRTMEHKIGFVKDHIETLKPLFTLDPTLLYAVLCFCPRKDVTLLFDHVPIHLALGRIAYQLNKSGYHSLQSYNFECDDLLYDPLKKVLKILLHVQRRNMEEIDLYLEAVHQLGVILSAKLTDCSLKEKQAVRLFSSLLLCIIHLLKQTHKEEMENASMRVKECKDKLLEFVKNWVVKHGVIGGSYFGTHLHYHDRVPKNTGKELKLWEDMLRLRFLRKEDSLIAEEDKESGLVLLPGDVADDWNQIVASIVKERVGAVSAMARIEIFCSLEGRTHTDEYLTNIIMTEAAKALDEVVLAPKAHYNTRHIEELQSSGSRKVVGLFGNLLKKKYPDFKGEIPFNELLDWDLWPGFMKIIVSKSKLKEAISEDWQTICLCALSQLADVCRRVISGDILVHELKMISCKEMQMSKLCDAAAVPPEKKDDLDVTSQEEDFPSFATLKKHLDMRLRELDCFMEYRAKLTQFIQICASVALSGRSSLQTELTKKVKDERISSLCISDGASFQVLHFTQAKELDPYLGQLWAFSHEYQSDLFNRLWMAQLDAHRPQGTLTLGDVIKKVWIPVFEQCTEIHGKLISSKITLTQVDQHFKQYSKNEKALATEIKSFHLAVLACRHKKDSSLAWIKTIITKMQQHWELSTYADAANAFLKIRDTLQLTGSFSLVERVATQASASLAAKDQTLEVIDHSAVEAGKFLKMYASDEKKSKCLEAFADCQKIVEWIREQTNDVNDLQNFVNIALATAAGGEDDLTRDKLSNLRTVGSGFGPLIYKLPKTAGYDVLQEHCKSLWDTLKHAPKLPKIMRDCEREIDWYQSVKETQGSVEVTSFGQMKNINQLGHYTIGMTKRGITTSRTEVIRLRLVETRGMKKLPKVHYTLDELRDLESKLVFITGRDSLERKEVDQFLHTFHSVCRIADVLIALQQHGNSKYLGWSLSFPCNIVNVVEELSLQASTMECHLEQWKKQVSEQRDEYYELNYFSTQQMLSLREELGKFKLASEAEAIVSPRVMAMLQSISPEVTEGDVKKQVLMMKTNLEKQQLTKSDQVSEPFVQQITHVKDTKQYIVDEVNLASSAPPEVDSHLEHHREKRSNQTIASEILAAAAHTTDPTAAPEPKLNMDQLTSRQRSILINAEENYGFPKKLILLAFERCERPDVENEIIDWCMGHEDEFQYGDSDTSSEVSASADESESEDELLAQPQLSSQPMEGVRYHRAEPVNANKSHVVVKSQVPVDEEHPVVIQLLDLGYDLEQCIQAAELHPEDAITAQDYLVEVGEIGEIFKDLLTEDSTLLTVTAMPLEKPAFEQQESSESPFEARQEGSIVISQMDTTKKVYLSLLELGTILRELSSNCCGSVPRNRAFPEMLKKGEPNLIVVDSDDVLKTTLALYMEDPTLPMPTHEEVLVCSEHTTEEEVTLLWKRALDDPKYFRTFSLVHAERLSYQTCDKALRSLSELSRGKKEYKLAIVCSNEDQDKSHMVSKLQLYHKAYAGSLKPIHGYQEYLKAQFINWSERAHKRELGRKVVASVVDLEKSSVRVVTSNRAGMGKSLYIKRLREALETQTSGQLVEVVVPVHGPVVTTDTVMKALMDHFGNKSATIFHLDIAPDVLWQVDSILFCLLVLHALCDSQGRVWRVHPCHLYTVEVTLPKGIEERVAKRTLSLLGILPRIHCASPRDILRMLETGSRDKFKTSFDDKEFRDHSFQRVFQYLRRHVGQLPLDRFSYTRGSVESNPKECLNILLSQCGVRDPSWSELKHFVQFLDLQLLSCEVSVFCNEALVGDVMAGLKTFVVKFMVRMSKDFATSSLKGEVAAENEEDVELEDLEKYEIDSRKQWEQSYHPYLFFNQDKISITFVGFNANQNGDLLDPVKNEVIERASMSTQLYTGLRRNEVNLGENYQHWDKQTMIQKIGMVMGLEWVSDPDPTYVLTVDNVIKMLAIQMRFRCNIPVVIMGETGCGKTRLIRYMCDLLGCGSKGGGAHVRNMITMKVHGGTTEHDILKCVEEAEQIAHTNRNDHQVDTVLFFDEANTTEAIGLIKEVMCDKRIRGREIRADVKFIAACNPYKKHTVAMIEKLESAGLGFYVKATETQQKLGRIPLRQLVYRVLDLPPSMRPLVYDFGQLNVDTEKDYTRQIVSDRCRDIAVVRGDTSVVNSIAQVLAWSQKYMRNRKDECSFVSLRDVERAMIVFKYFCSKLLDIRRAQTDMEDDLSDITRSLILAVSVCYHARLQDRVEYEKGVAAQFTGPLALPRGASQFCEEIKWCQDAVLNNMKLGDNIAKNIALRENVFMMAVCIELRIPLFLVGKPGSSKSLAKSIVADSMHGQSSENQLLKTFKEVHMFSYQCSQLSTPESVIEVFKTAQSFQKKQDTTKYVSVVVLDEVGLAEDSPNLPLKALHPLLEDGTEGADRTHEVVDREKRVAFIGISNWALDPAKMNRGVMVTRGDPDEKELEISARGICSNRDDDPVKERLNSCFAPLSAAYKRICDKQKRAFFGLRDFYSLIKMLYWMCRNSNRPPTEQQLEHAIRRNFGGLEQKDLDPLEIFKEHLLSTGKPADIADMTEEEQELLYPDCSPLGLIKTSLKSRDTTWHGENRYLLFLTENYAALQVLKHYLQDEVGITQVMQHAAQEENAFPSLEDTEAQEEDRRGLVRRMEPFVLFGSSFPKDKEYTQVCRNINQIKICMETGRTVILLNLENLYESLYDLLNQYYIFLGGTRYVDLGLQTHRVKCRVHNDFKLILIAEKDTVYEKFPTPLINRLEKHFVLTETVLLNWQRDVLYSLTVWVTQFSGIPGTRFQPADAFVGYQNDTPASVVFQATQHVRHEQGGQIPEEMEECYEWKDAILQCSQHLLLQMASPDALVRLKDTSLASSAGEFNKVYFTEQHHGSIRSFLSHHLKDVNSVDEGALIQVTTHGHLLSNDELQQLALSIGMGEGMVSWFLLQEFDTELDFSNKVSPLFTSTSEEDRLLIIQCDSGHLYGDLIACARYRIDDEREKARVHARGRTHVLFIIHLPRRGDIAGSSFVGFQGGQWISSHIDEIQASSEDALTLDEALSAPISDLFYNMGFVSHKRKTSSKKSTRNLDDINNYPTDDSIDTEGRMQQHVPPNAAFEEEEGAARDHKMFFQPMDVELESQSEQGINTRPIQSLSPEELARRHAQCARLYNCIQAAVARMVDTEKSKEWAARRVKLLLDLIPHTQPSPPLDECTFFGALVKHILNVLKQRDKIVQEGEWVLMEAMNEKKLQSGGTFRNVLSRKLDEVVVPIFAEILAFVDRYSNLDLISKGNQDQPCDLFWLTVFTNESLCRFSYEQIAMRRGLAHQIPGVSGKRVSTYDEFKCQFPFFWLIKDIVDSLWDNAKGVAGGHRQIIFTQLCKLLEDSPVADAVESVDINLDEFYSWYCHDFVRTVHQVTHKQGAMEYKLITDALHMVIISPELASTSKSLLYRVAAVHVAYYHCQQEIMWFGQLTTHKPGILAKLGNIKNGVQMELHLRAVHEVLEDLKPPLEQENKHQITKWLTDVQLFQNIIDSILALDNDAPLIEELSIRKAWYQLRAIHIFVEHIVTKFEGTEVYAKRLQLLTQKSSDFTKDETVAKLQKLLSTVEKDHGKKKHVTSAMKKQFHERCKSFFMELVSSLCFGRTTPPEPALIKSLLDIVFTEKQGTKEFTFSSKEETDAVPVIRSFLLQLLLEHNVDEVKSHLQEYFDRSRQTMQESEHLPASQTIDQNLCLLCIQCFEDALFKQHCKKPLANRINWAFQMLSDRQASANQPQAQGYLSLEYLESVSQVRFALSVVSELLYKQSEKDSQAASHLHTNAAQILIQVAKDCCMDDAINEENSGPAVYLVKLLVRNYGMSFLAGLTADPAMEWVVPSHLRRSKEDSHIYDYFVIYNPLYSRLRTLLSDAVYGQKFSELSASTQDLKSDAAVPLLLAVYHFCDINQSTINQARKISDEVLGEVDKFTKSCKFIPRELLWTAKAFFKNTYCGPLQEMCATPQARMVTGVVVHTVLALLSQQSAEILEPFLKMLNTPGELKRAYLPAMPEDLLPQARSVIHGNFYECPKGHPYFVSECGRPTMEYTCPQCGAKIGGLNHRLLGDNKDARTSDITQKGYALDDPAQRGPIPSPERNLPPAACAILRALMHSSLLWTSCNNEDAIVGLVELTKDKVKPADLPGFFWKHLQCDVDVLAKAIGRSKDDACLLLHLVLRDIATKTPPHSSGMKIYASLLAREARVKWESDFNIAYIQQLVGQLDRLLQQATSLILKDSSEEQDRLFYMVYEKSSVAEGSVIPHLWTYRSRITLEHLYQTLQAQDKRKQCPILSQFLTEEPVLRATQYLPGIVQLQQQMYDSFHRRLDRKEANQSKIRDFIGLLEKENKKNLFREKLRCLETAWGLVKEQLSEYSRVRVDPRFLGVSFTDENLPVAYIIPTLSGPGVCSVALVDLLVGAHNSFIERCKGEMDKRQQATKGKKETKGIPIGHIQRCHLLDYEHHLLSIVLSHCQYSLRHGQAQEIVYDLPALEKHIMDRFIHGKPLIQLEIPQVVYRKDVYTAATFASIRKKVHPQVKLSAKERKEIISELQTMQQLQEVLDVVEIVMGFLSSGGGNAKKSLKEYIKTTLKMEHKFSSKKASEHCHLSHVLSLWETLSVELAKKHTMANMEAFDNFRDEFLEELYEEAEDGSNQLEELNQKLRSLDIPPLLNMLYEFIETFVRHCESNEKSWPLISTLKDHLEYYGLDPLPEGLVRLFPASITLGQAVATWKCIVHYQCHLEYDLNF